ncbi:MAG: hypothetical protein HFJ27_06245 [Clostridia bacterium]|nr:hypothetical protein [Clostridia bacterium]
MHHGKEIYLFFGKYQGYGLLGIAVSSILTGLMIYKVLSIAKKEEINNYQDFLRYLQPNEIIREVTQIIIQLFLLISFYIMIAGFSAYFSQEWGIPNYIGCAIIIILCYFVLRGNIERLIKVNTFLIPILILFIIQLILKNITAFTLLEKINTSNIYLLAIKDAIIYTSYNSIMLIPMLLSLGKCIKHKRSIIIIVSICIILLTILAISIFGLILKIDIDINKLELPTVYVAGMMNKTYQILYGIIILVSIYTSAISAGYGFLQKYQNKPKQYNKMLVLVCIIAFFVSNIGFTNLVNLLYPVFGILGLIQMFQILKKK